MSSDPSGEYEEDSSDEEEDSFEKGGGTENDDSFDDEFPSDDGDDFTSSEEGEAWLHDSTEPSDNPEVAAPEEDNDSFEITDDPIEIPKSNKNKSKNKKSLRVLDDSMRSATETTVDLDFSTSDWNFAQDEVIVVESSGDNVIPTKKTKTKKKNKSVKTVRDEENQVVKEDGEAATKSKRTRKKGNDEGQNQDNVEIRLKQEAEASPIGAPTSKKSKRKNKKSMKMTEDDAEAEEALPRENVIMEIVAEWAGTSQKRVEHADSTGKEELASTKKKKKRATSQEVALQSDASMLVDPVTVNAARSDDISLLSDEPARATPEEKKKSRHKRKSDGKSPEDESSQDVSLGMEPISLSTLLDDVVSTRNQWHDSLEKSSCISRDGATFSQRLMHFLERMLDSFAELSDALQLIVTFGDADPGRTHTSEIDDARETMISISTNYAPLLNYLWKAHLQSTMERYWEKESEDDALKHLLYRAALVLKVLSAQFRDQFIDKGEPPMEIERNPETKMLFVTLFELLRHEAFAVWTHQRDREANREGDSTFQPSAMLQQAWNVGLDSKEWHEVYRKAHIARKFRRACLRFVIGKSGRSKPLVCDKAMALLLDYCELENLDVLGESAHEQPNVKSEDEGKRAAPRVPKAAKLVLKNIRGTPLPRDQFVEKVLCRILPLKRTDASPNSVTVLQGRPGVGKTTIAALAGQHVSVREYFCDGIIWIRLGQCEDLNYSRYNMHLAAMLSQIHATFEELNQPDNLHVPGESEEQRCERERKSSRRKDVVAAATGSLRDDSCLD